MMNPRIGCAVLLFDDQNRILLGKRISAHEGGIYGVPGGKMDGGESPIIAASREVWEETHMRVSYGPEPIGYIANCVYPKEDNHFLCIWFKAQVDPRDLDLRFVETGTDGKPKNEGWNWYPVPNVLGDAHPEVRPLMLSTRPALRHMLEGGMGKLRFGEFTKS